MKKSFFLSFTIAIFAVSCNNKTKQSEQPSNTADTSKPAENKIQIPKTLCFSSVSGKDTVLLRMDIFDSIVTGNLEYKLREKDSNKGEFEGKLKGDTLLADYKFMSEGKQSVREVVFLIKDSIATEGYGGIEEKNGKMVFKDVNQVNFAKGLTLQRVSCN